MTGQLTVLVRPHGGGQVQRRAAADRVGQGGLPAIYLAMRATETVKRIGVDAARPLLTGNPHMRWRELMEARRHSYEESATVVVTDHRTAGEVADATLATLSDP
ncbi:shikimate kinase [Streptomyces beihaiensis]|uniref:Shikimate kinase n=1 Tax=Streptomyces beihaiensis TaxID=2984495 RepID=A0ABT3U0R0_9ACTN|nr:shikimate kinase [Streptomyces beihaiensis]MCX3062903.1 hypothetical protein [Streptomyces beihaiensis]